MSTISCQQRQFKTLETGEVVTCYSLRNTSGMTVNLLDYGAILNAVQIPDLRGDMHEITLGSNQLADFENTPLSGSTLIHLPKRYGITFDHLNRMCWQAESITQDKAASVKLTCQGKLPLKYSLTSIDYQCTTEYTLTATDELIIQSQIQTSLSLPVFMTHHPIWNLTGGTRSEINDHVLQVWASQYSEMDAQGFSELNFLESSDHPAFDFQKPQRIETKKAQINKAGSNDICFYLKEKEEASSVRLAAYVKAPVSGRTLEVFTNQPGLRFYLQSNTQKSLQGFCLSPMPLLDSTDSKPPCVDIIQQETRYKLTW